MPGTLFPTTIAGSLPKPPWLAAPNKLWAPWRLEGEELADANHILARHGVLDGFGRVAGLGRDQRPQPAHDLARHGELEAARAPLDGMVGELVAMSQQMAEAAAAADRARAELGAYRSRPWWLRLTG